MKFQRLKELFKNLLCPMDFIIVTFFYVYFINIAVVKLV